MLKFLHIENIAVIEKADIDFSVGFNVLTGETGAGKSIVIDSINAVLGERTSKELIRNGCESAEVSALFGCLDDITLDALNEYSLEPDDDGNILIRRILSNNGKGYIKLNDRPITATALREISKNLINIHGQHDNQALLDPLKHYLYIDLIADNEKLKENYYKEFRNLNSIRKALLELETDEDEKQKQVETLNYQIAELEKADIKIGEMDTLKEKLEIALNYQKTFEGLSTAYACLKGNEDFDGAITQMTNASKQLSLIENDKFKKSALKLNDVISSTLDIASEIEDFLENTEFSEINPDEINVRLDLLYKLMLKYGEGEENLLNVLEESRNELDCITSSDKKIEELSISLDKSTEKLVSLGDTLSKSRKSAALLFEKSVTDVLKYLNMPDVSFLVDIEKQRYTKYGCDNVEFKISTNKGESVKPLVKIASGGELSRVMLSIKSALLDKDTVGTMIFDEIDTGISGYAADKVGIQLKKVSENRQVICVTHLAQIAAIADYHLLIKKSTVNSRTFTKVEPLSYEERIKEIARIMSGTEMTESLYNSAKELLDRRKQDENL